MHDKRPEAMDTKYFLGFRLYFACKPLLLLLHKTIYLAYYMIKMGGRVYKACVKGFKKKNDITIYNDKQLHIQMSSVYPLFGLYKH